MTKIKDRYVIKRKYISNKNARPQLKNLGIEFLVAHETANDTADAEAHYRYFNNIDFQASAHTFVDDNTILEIIPLDEKAWHVRYNVSRDNQMYGDDANDVAIGTELCRTGDFSQAYDRYVWYHAYLCRKFGLNPKRDIVAHSKLDPSRRTDPQSWLEPNGVSWDQFVNDVHNYYQNWDNESDKELANPGQNKPQSNFTGHSITDYLKSIGEPSNYDARAKLARQYGIKGYRGTAAQNLRLLELLRNNKKSSRPSGNSYTSVVDYMKANGMESSFSNRKKLAGQYGITNYRGTANQNIQLLNKLRAGQDRPSRNASYIGKRVESKHNGQLRFYARPSWEDKDVAGYLTKGYGFPTIMDKMQVRNGHQYKVKNSKGHVYYVTASSRYVKVV